MGKKIWRFLTSLQLAVWLIVLIALLCTAATLLPQGSQPLFYTQTYGGFFGTVILVLSLDNVFHSAPFLFLGFVFAINLSCCTYMRLKWAVAMSKQQKGLSPWGSPVLHVGLVLVLLGVAVSVLLGRESYYEIMKGETIEVYEANRPFQMRVDDVVLEFYPDTDVPMQYTTKMTLTAEDGTTVQEIAAVNNRGKFNGGAILQSHYGWATTLELDENGEKRTLHLKDEVWQTVATTEEGVWKLGSDFMPDYTLDPERGPYSASERPKNPKAVFVLALNDDPVALALAGPGETVSLTEDKSITLLGYDNFTGLHIKYDPGVPLIFAGFVLTCVGLVLRFMPLPASKKEDAADPPQDAA